MDEFRKLILSRDGDYIEFNDHWIRYKDLKYPTHQVAFYPTSDTHVPGILGQAYILMDLKGDVISKIHVNSNNYREIRSLTETIRKGRGTVAEERPLR